MLHALAVFAIYELLVLTQVISRFDVYHFKTWDATIYASIAENGYAYSDTVATNSGFYPLFPYIWRLVKMVTGGGWAAICILNFLMFATGTVILKKIFTLSRWQFLFLLSVPSCMFMLVPYSEATFFLFSTVVIAGLKSGNRAMAWTGLLLASLTRPAGVFFIPAIIISELLSQALPRQAIRNMLVLVSAPVAGTLMMVLLQYASTGVWFAYFRTQSKFFRHSFHLPELPFNTWEADKMLWLDGTALFFGLLALAMITGILIRRYRDKQTASRADTFSLACIVMAVAATVFYNAKDVTGGTTLLSLHRYVLATPFFFVMLILLARAPLFRTRFWLTYFVTACLTMLLLKFSGDAYYRYNNFDRMVYAAFTFGSMLTCILTSVTFSGRYLPLLYTLNVIAQLMLLHRFAYKLWAG